MLGVETSGIYRTGAHYNPVMCCAGNILQLFYSYKQFMGIQ